MRRAKARHVYNVIRVLQDRIADLTGHMTLHPDVPLTPEQEANLSRMQLQLREKEAEAKEKWGATWIQAGLKDFQESFPADTTFSPILEEEEESPPCQGSAPGYDS